MIELMVVVTIIGVGAAMSAAGVADAFSESRASRAARELVRLGRRARSDAMGYLRAYMVWIQPGANRVTLLRAWSSSCTNENWDGRMTNPAMGGLGCGGVGVPIPQASACVEQVRFTDALYSNDAFRAQVRLDVAGVPTATNVAICYAPSGAMYTQRPANLAAVGPATLTPQNAVNQGALRFWIQRVDGGGAQVGVRRLVLFPQGAPPRLER